MKKRIIVPNGTVTVAIAVIQREDGRVLIGHRRADHYRRPGEWEFPGGKKEKQETPEMAVIREAKEETNLMVTVKGCMTETWCNYPDGVYRHVFVYLCLPMDKDPQPVSVSGDYTEMKWVAPSDRETWQDNRIPPMDRSVLEALMDTRMKKELLLIRGVPGSGKSTLASKMKLASEKEGKVCQIFEADDFFMKGSHYDFNADLLPEVHNTCFHRAKAALEDDRTNTIIVSNTFVKKWEIEPYLRLGSLPNVTVRVLRMSKCFGSTHGVPEDKIEKMKQNMEPVAGEKYATD